MSHCYSIIYQHTSCMKVLSSRNHHHTNLRVVLKSTLILLSTAWLSFQGAGSCYPYLQPTAPRSLCSAFQSQAWGTQPWHDLVFCPGVFTPSISPTPGVSWQQGEGCWDWPPQLPSVVLLHSVPGMRIFPWDGMRKSVVNPSILARETFSHKDIIFIVFLHFTLGRSRRSGMSSQTFLQNCFYPWLQMPLPNTAAHVLGFPSVSLIFWMASWKKHLHGDLLLL